MIRIGLCRLKWLIDEEIVIGGGRLLVGGLQQLQFAHIVYNKLE